MIDESFKVDDYLVKLVRDTEVLVKEAWRQLESKTSSPGEILSDRGKDIKIIADQFLHDVLTDGLSNILDVPIISEEGKPAVENMRGSFWVLDPVDGSMNFSKNIGFYSTSIGLVLDNKMCAGIIYMPSEKFFYHGIVNGRAYRDYHLITASLCSRADKAVLATGFPLFFDVEKNSMEKFINNVGNFKKIRMFGSASCSLAMVAEGKCDCYWEDNIMLWDVLAGLVLVRASGGDFIVEDGSVPFSLKVFAAGRNLMDDTAKSFITSGRRECFDRLEEI